MGLRPVLGLSFFSVSLRVPHMYQTCGLYIYPRTLPLFSSFFFPSIQGFFFLFPSLHLLLRPPLQNTIIHHGDQEA